MIYHLIDFISMQNCLFYSKWWNLTSPCRMSCPATAIMRQSSTNMTNCGLHQTGVYTTTDILYTHLVLHAPYTGGLLPIGINALSLKNVSKSKRMYVLFPFKAFSKKHFHFSKHYLIAKFFHISRWPKILPFFCVISISFYIWLFWSWKALFFTRFLDILVWLILSFMLIIASSLDYKILANVLFQFLSILHYQ